MKGKSYFDYPNKYYSEDLGLRNARIGFRDQDRTRIMENAEYNELLRRGFDENGVLNVALTDFLLDLALV